MRSDAETVDEYLDALPEERREALASLRRAIAAIAPEAHELMKYGHPHWELGGALFALASQKRHMALYVAEKQVMARLAPRFDALTGVDTGKGCVRFRTREHIPVDLVERLLEDAARARREAMGEAS